MQDKSINNALLALRKQIIRCGLDGLPEVEALCRLRGVRMARVMPAKCNTTARRGHMAFMVTEALRACHMTRKQLVEYIAPLRPDVPPERVYWRVDAALSKLRMNGRVVRDFGADGCLWRLV